MRRSAIAFLLIAVLAAAGSAQSGRKTVKSSSTPSVAAGQQNDETTDFSESKPADGFSYSKKKLKQQRDESPQPKADNSSSGDEDTIKVSTDLVSIPVSVYERSGVYVSGLRRNDFKIFEDGKPQEIAYFGTTEVPFSVVLLIEIGRAHV